MPQLATHDVVRRRRTPRSSSADEFFQSKSWGKVAVAEIAHPIIQALKPSTRWVYICLRSLAIEKNESRWYIGYGELASLTGINRRTVRRCVAELVVWGLVIQRPRWGQLRGWAKPGHLANEYQVKRVDELRDAAALLAELTRPVSMDGDYFDEEEEELFGDDPELDEHVEQAVSTAEAVIVMAEPEAIAESAARSLLPAVIAAQAQVDAAVEALLKLPRIPLPEGVIRATNPAATQDAYRARAARQGVGIALELAGAQLRQVHAALVAGEPLKSWRHTLAAIRLTLSLASGASERLGMAAADVAVAAESFLTAYRPSKKMVARDAAPKVGQEWYPPPKWEPLMGGKTAKTWRSHRATWEAAKGQRLYKVADRLIAQGFDPKWPDPPVPGKGPP